MKLDHQQSWAAIRLTAVISSRNIKKLEELTGLLDINFTQAEIAQIWKRVRIVLTERDTDWLTSQLQILLEGKADLSSDSLELKSLQEEGAKLTCNSAI